MATKIVTKNSSTASAVPTASDLVQGELAVNVADKRLFTEDNAGAIVELGTNPSGNVTFQDNGKAIFGAGSDLQIYHDGSDSYVSDVGTGRLFLSSNGDGVNVVTNTGENLIRTDNDGQVRVYFDNSEKIRTNSTGIDVTGVITTDGMITSADINFGDNDKATFGASDDLQIYHDGSNSFISDEGAGSLYVRGSSQVRVETPTGENMAIFNDNGGVSLRYNNVKKFETTSTGIDVTGTATMDGLTVDGDAKISDTLPRFILNETDATDLNTAFRNNGGVLKVQTVNDAGNSFTSRLDVDHSTGDISFYEDTGTTPKLFWDASAESLGIGTSSPSEELELASSSPTIRLTDTNDSTYGSVSYNVNALMLSGDNTIRCSTGGTERLRIDASGRVGIGTSSPSSSISSSSTVLEIADSNVASLALNNTTQSTKFEIASVDVSGGALSIRDNNTERMRIDSLGNVGIGTSSPSEKLQVDGNIRIGDTATGTNDDEEYSITSGGQLLISANDSAADVSYSGLILNAGKAGGAAASSSLVTIKLMTQNACA